jgi:hypothetical protein
VQQRVVVPDVVAHDAVKAWLDAAGPTVLATHQVASWTENRDEGEIVLVRAAQSVIIDTDVPILVVVT